MFTFLPFLHAAIRLRRVWVWAVALLFALISASTIYVSEQSDGALSDAVFAIVILGSLVVGVTLLTRLRREVYGLGAGRLDVTAEDTSEVDPAVRHVLEARAKRARARELAATDPLLARELHIGRPDLHSDYDDGGLVDIATAPESVIAQVLNLPDEQAAGIVAVRDTAITVDDLFTMTGLPLNTWEHIRDRAVIIR